MSQKVNKRHVDDGMFRKKVPKYERVTVARPPPRPGHRPQAAAWHVRLDVHADTPKLVFALFPTGKRGWMDDATTTTTLGISANGQGERLAAL